MSRLAELCLEPLPFVKAGDILPCASTGEPDLMHPGLENPEGQRKDQGIGKRICSGCPVQTECLMYALNRPFLTGIWGGMNEEDRGRWRRQHPAFVPSNPTAPWAEDPYRDADWVVTYRKQQERRVS